MFESRAMARYVDEKAGHKLTPKDRAGPREDGAMDQRRDLGLLSARDDVHLQDVFKRPQQEEVLANAGTKLEQCVGVMDAALAASGKPFLVGDQFTLADVVFAPYVEYCMVSPSAKAIFAKHPHFTAWWNRVSERPAWQKVRA